MSKLNAPKINITFSELAKTAIERSERGRVMLWVKDVIKAPLANPIKITSVDEIPAELSEATKKQVKLALKGYVLAPRAVILYCMGIAEGAENGAVEAGYNNAMAASKFYKFDYLAIPTVETDAKTEDVASWVKSCRQQANIKRFKAVLPNITADQEGVINYPITKTTCSELVTAEDGTAGKVNVDYTTEQFCARMAGLIAGTPLTISCTYAPLAEVVDCTKVEDVDAEVNKGNFFIFYDGEKYKTNRAVNSFTTLVQGKGDSFKKIKIVEAMDMIYDDVKTTIEDAYLGKYSNSFDNKMLLVSAISEYFKQLIKEGIVGSYNVELDLQATKDYLAGKGIDYSDMDDETILKQDTGSHVFITATVKILDAMEDVDLPIAI